MWLEGEDPVDGVVLNPRLSLLLLGGKTFVAAGKGKIQSLLLEGVCIVAGRGLDVNVACFGGFIFANVVALTEGLIVADGYRSRCCCCCCWR